MNGKELTAVTVVFMFTVLMPLTVGIVLRLLKWSGRQAPPLADPASSARLDRLEQGMEAIAIEIERISEGQRFVTKVLTDRPMETIRAPERQSRPSITPH
jgi:hypothetical protein